MHLPPGWQQAESALLQEQWSTAFAGFQRIVEQQPRHVGAWLSLSQACSGLQRHRQALQCALSAHAIGVAEPALVFGLARRLRRFCRYAELVDCLRAPRFVAEVPAQAIAEAVVMLASIGADDHALVLVDTGLRRFPENASLLFVRGNLHAFSGRFGNAEADYERSMVSDPALFQSSWMLAGLRTQRGDANHVERLQAQLASATPGRMGEIYLNFALHKELHDLGRYPEAWEALERGCQAKRAKVQYLAKDTHALFRELRALCGPGFFDGSVDLPAQQPVPIFIVGMHRSGTTLLERMLGGHAGVASAGETYAFAEQMKLATDWGTPGVLHAETVRRASRVDFDAVAHGYQRTAEWLARGRSHFTEKLPSNFLHVGFIARALPHARIIHMRRDPMDTCFSNLRTLYSEAAAYSYDQHELADYWREYLTLMQHWHAVLPGRILDVDYSALVADPEPEIRRTARFCGLPYTPAMLVPQRAGGSVATASVIDVRAGILRDRHRAWEPYRDHLQPLIAQLPVVPAG